MRTAIALLGACLLAGPARAADAPETPPVDVALVLVDDVSRSIDDAEFRLQKQGYLYAFTNPAVIAAIHGGQNGAIAVAYVEFASVGETRVVIDWTVIRDAASAKAFADRLNAEPRSFWGRTAIGEGITAGIHALASSGYKATRQVIDVCGDGTNNAGRDVDAARDEAVAAGITVNGLAIINDHPVAWAYAHVQPPGGLGKYYRENVTGGPGSFVAEIHDFHAFGNAITRKLVDEIARIGDRGGAPRG
ncbi:MAG: DUF1194 domain-containing protein [Alphaproteobacteria bacterium]|nr:DUF1194 domain-containing protein [Alphaproteobacteria bacterium]